MGGRSLLWGLLLLGAPQVLEAQHLIILESELDDYVRLLELAGRVSGPLVFRSPSALAGLGLSADSAHPWSRRYPFEDPKPASPGLRLRNPPYVGLTAVYNSDHPWGTNDGALWAGRGASAALVAGTRLTWGPLSATLMVQENYAQNRDFPLWPPNAPGYSPYAYPWNPRNIDWPQRFGDRSFWAFDWAQSDLRLNLGHFTAGLSNENLWWGPAVRNPILMSNTAPGFPHLDLGVGRPVNVGVGTLETRLVWGRLRESDYFDTVSANDHRLFTGFTLGLRPRWIPGLTLGLSRVLYTTWDSLRIQDFVDVFQPFFKDQIATPTDPEGSDDRDQLLSLVARWVLPASGFETYVEWARNDHARNLRDFILEPDHSQAYTLGFAQLLGSRAAPLRLRGEWTHLGRSPTFQVRAEPTYYVHHIVRQGYTQKGQLLGAGIGPGSDAQYLGLDRYHAGGRWGFYLQRVRWNDDAYYRMYGRPGGRDGHDVELTAGGSLLRFVGRVDVGLELAVSREINRYYQIGTNATNVTVKWTLQAR